MGELESPGAGEPNRARMCAHAGRRCIMAEADGALYVAFMGTKQRRDLVANAQVMQDPVWPDQAAGLADAQVTLSVPSGTSHGPCCSLVILGRCSAAACSGKEDSRASACKACAEKRWPVGLHLGAAESEAAC